MNLNFNFNGSTRLKQWWKIVRDNFTTIQNLFNTHQTSEELDHPDKSVKQRHIADKAVGQAQIADYSIGQTQLAQYSVSSAKIHPEAVQTSHIKDGSVIKTKLSDEIVSVLEQVPGIREDLDTEVENCKNLDARITKVEKSADTSLQRKIETTRTELFGDKLVSHALNFDITWQYMQHSPSSTFSNLESKSFTVNLDSIFGDCYMDLDENSVFDNMQGWEKSGWNTDFKLTVGDISSAYIIFCVDTVSKEIWLETTNKEYTMYNGTYSNGVWIFPIGNITVVYTQSNNKYTASIDWIFYSNIGSGADVHLNVNGTALAPNNLNTLSTEDKGSFWDAINENAEKIKDLSPLTVDTELSNTSENPVQNKVIKTALDNLTLSGGGIVSVEQTTTSNADGGTNIITVMLSDGTVSTFTVKNGSKGSTGAKGDTGSTGAKGDTGTRGSQWYSGTALTGTATGTNYSYSGASNALVGDYYLNTSTGSVYRCVISGSGTTAKWQYQGSIKSATGNYAEVDSALSSTSTNPVQNKVIKDALDNKLDASFNSNGYADLNAITLELSDMIGEHLAPPTTITIGCADSKHQWLTNYHCSGSNDTTVFQNAINALSSGGGKIVVLEGTYTISSALTCNENVIIEGMGNGTVINCTNHAFLSNTAAGCRIAIRDMAFNLTGTMTAAAPFISAKSDLDLICCSVTATTTVSESWTDYIKTYANANIAFTAFDVSVKSTYTPSCCAIFGFTDGYNNTVSFCDITLTNNTTNSYELNLYVSRGHDTISSCRATLIGASSSSYAILTEGSNAVTGCYIDVTNSYGDINNFKDGSSTTNGVFSGNKVYYASGARLMFNRVSDNYFKGSGTLHFSGSAPIVTSNRFVNSVSNSISGSSYIIFKDNTLKYSCTVTSSSTAKVSDNIVYSGLT